MAEHHPNRDTANRHRKALLIAHLAGPTTADRAAERAGLHIVDAAYTTRLWEIERAGYLVRTGLRVKSMIGHNRMVRELTEEGRELALALLTDPGMPWPRR